MTRRLDPDEAPDPLTKAVRGGYGEPVSFYGDLLGRGIAMLIPGAAGRWIGRALYWTVSVIVLIVSVGYFLLQLAGCVAGIAGRF